MVVFNCVYDLRMYPFDSQICLMEFQVNGIPTRYLDIGIEMPEDCPECDGGEYLGNRNLVEYLVGSTVMVSVLDPCASLLLPSSCTVSQGLLPSS